MTLTTFLLVELLSFCALLMLIVVPLLVITYRTSSYRTGPEPGTHVIVRTYSAGVFAGVLRSRKDREVVLLNSRRLWYWDGAASLSELAVEGTSKPDKCKFPVPIPEHLIMEVIEVIPTTEKARKSIDEVLIWTAH